MTIQGIIEKITREVLNPLIIMLFALATVLFVWGLITYIIASQGNPAKLDMGKKAILWGIIGMTIMASAWGIVRILCGFFGVGTTCI